MPSRNILTRLRREKGSRSLNVEKVQVPPGSSRWHRGGGGPPTSSTDRTFFNFLETSWKLPANGHQLPPHIPCIVTSEISEGVRQTDSSSSSQVPVCPCSPPLHNLPSQPLFWFTSSPGAEALPCGGRLTSPHICTKSKLLILYHSWGLHFSNQILTDTGTKPSTTPLFRALTASTSVFLLQVSSFASFLAPENFILFIISFWMQLLKCIFLLKNCVCL